MVIDSYKVEGQKKKGYVWCVWRENSQFNHNGCPYNIPKRRQFETYCEMNNVRYKEW